MDATGYETCVACGEPDGVPHAEDCAAVEEVRQQDAEYRAWLEEQPEGVY